MQKHKDFYLLGESGFWRKFFSKLLFTLISVKLWGLVASIAVSTWLLLIHNTNEPYLLGGDVFERGINGAQWVTFNTTIWALIFGMKEIFRISEKRDKTEKEVLAQQSESKKELATIVADSKVRTAKRPSIGSKEVVGEEPE